MKLVLKFSLQYEVSEFDHHKILVNFMTPINSKNSNLRYSH